MICFGYTCMECTHLRPNIDGWICACNAFPDGIPDEYLFDDIDVNERAECNNGIGFEPREEK